MRFFSSDIFHFTCWTGLHLIKRFFYLYLCANFVHVFIHFLHLFLCFLFLTTLKRNLYIADVLQYYIPYLSFTLLTPCLPSSPCLTVPFDALSLLQLFFFSSYLLALPTFSFVIIQRRTSVRAPCVGRLLTRVSKRSLAGWRIKMWTTGCWPAQRPRGSPQMPTSVSSSDLWSSWAQPSQQ